ncbi:MAG: cyclase [Bacteroidia bacterium]|nr:cyclase [Bacteroidia bacterium]
MESGNHLKTGRHRKAIRLGNNKITQTFMVTTILSHEVKDYADWKQGFDSDESNRSKMGVTVSGVYQSAENPNMVTVITEVPNIEAIKSFMANPELKANMEKAGVIGMPDIKILNKM